MILAVPQIQFFVRLCEHSSCLGCLRCFCVDSSGRRLLVCSCIQLCLPTVDTCIACLVWFCGPLYLAATCSVVVLPEELQFLDKVVEWYIVALLVTGHWNSSAFSLRLHVFQVHDVAPARIGSPLGKVYKLLKAMYGLRDAGAAFDRKVLDVMNLMGVTLGKFSICEGHRKVMDTLVMLVRWSDDFSLSGGRSLCKAFRDELGKALVGQDDSCDGA